MKTEAEIRRHAKALATDYTLGCLCLKCITNHAAHQVLLWLLEERPDQAHFDELVAKFDAEHKS